MVHLCTSELESTWYGHSAEYFAQTPVFPYELCRPLSHKCGRVYRVASPFNILGWLWLAQLPQPAPQAGPIRRTCPMSFSCYCTFQFRNWWILSWTGSSLLFVLSDCKTLLSQMVLLEIGYVLQHSDKAVEVSFFLVMSWLIIFPCLKSFSEAMRRKRGLAVQITFLPVRSCHDGW